MNPQNVLEEFRETYLEYCNKARVNSTESTKRECQRFVNQTSYVINTKINYKKNLDSVMRYQQQKGVTSKLIKSNLKELNELGLIHLNSNSLRHKCFIDVTLALFWGIYCEHYFHPPACLSLSHPETLPKIGIAPQPSEELQPSVGFEEELQTSIVFEEEFLVDDYVDEFI